MYVSGYRLHNFANYSVATIIYEVKSASPFSFKNLLLSNEKGDKFMVRIILASHGEFALGLHQSSEMIFGTQEEVKCVTLMPSDGPETFRSKVDEAVVGADEVLFLVDLWGGTPFNQISMALNGHEEKWAIVTGMNLPMVIEAYVARNSIESAHEMATLICEKSKEGILTKIATVQAAPKANSAPAQKPKANKIPEGTVVGDGKINYVFARVDTRLLHGQVATTWTKETKPQRIVIASNSVAKDELRKTMIVQAAPPGVKVHVVALDQLVKIDSDPRFGGTRMMVLFETPQDALYCIEKGVAIEKLCLGSMAHSLGKVVATRALAFNADDVKTVEALLDKNVNVYGQTVPSESPLKVADILKKAKDLL